MSFVVPLVAGALSFLLLDWMLSGPRKALPWDHPNERSLHARPVPRVGGVALCAGMLPAIAWAWSPVVAALAAWLAVVSYFDDRNGLPASVRFAAHLAAAITLVVLLGGTQHWLLLACAALATVWMTNLYNFMDGADGLAGSMALVGFGAYAAAAVLAEKNDLAVASAAIACSAAAFLRFNWHPARTFMGDCGSIPLGFLAAAQGLAGWREDTWPWWFPCLVFSPFTVDATVTLLRRIFAGEPFWKAHRSHYYQRLVQLGWGHRKTVLAELALMAGCAATGLLALHAPPFIQAVGLACMGGLYLLLGLMVDRLWKRYVTVRHTL